MDASIYFFQVNVVSSIVHGNSLFSFSRLPLLMMFLFFFRQAKSMGNKSLVRS